MRFVKKAGGTLPNYSIILLSSFPMLQDTGLRPEWMNQARQKLKARYRPLSRPLPPGPTTTERDVAKMDLSDLFGVFVFIFIIGTCAVCPISFALEWSLGRWKEKRVAKKRDGVVKISVET